ncbi:MAG: hypothetical protein FWB74_10605, partial [Defluviitaleaceae bacterium]|nr:hypothetical protein [Defluviitaleaceae bacterium]
ALSLCEEEVRAIMANLGIESVMHHDFLQIMHKGSSRICGIYRRELETNSPITYECEDIAYIYNLDINDVKNAFQNLKIHEVTAVTMPLVFAKIPY